MMTQQRTTLVAATVSICQPLRSWYRSGIARYGYPACVYSGGRAAEDASPVGWGEQGGRRLNVQLQGHTVSTC